MQSSIDQQVERSDAMAETSTFQSAPNRVQSQSLTPPPLLIFERSPYARVPLPPISNLPIRLHPLLSAAVAPPIDYDITMPPVTARRNASDRLNPNTPWKSALATNPECSSESFMISHPSLERLIVIYPRHPASVTIWDVLSAVFKAFRASALKLHQSSDIRRQMVHQVGDKNVGQAERVNSVSEDELLRAIISRQLGGKIHWAGLYENSADARDGVWTLNLR